MDDLHDAAEAAAVALPPDAVPHECMPWAPSVRTSWRYRALPIPESWVVRAVRAIADGGVTYPPGSVLPIDVVLTFDGRRLRQLHEAHHVCVEPVYLEADAETADAETADAETAEAAC